MGCCTQAVPKDKNRDSIKIKKPGNITLKNENDKSINNGVRQTNINGMVVEASETDMNKVYLEFADQVPANN